MDRLTKLIQVEDALDMMLRGMTRAEFVGCTAPEYRAQDDAAWMAGRELVRAHGTMRKALNHVRRGIESFR
jgi:hypothetical protein